MLLGGVPVPGGRGPLIILGPPGGPRGLPGGMPLGLPGPNGGPLGPTGLGPPGLGLLGVPGTACGVGGPDLCGGCC